MGGLSRQSLILFKIFTFIWADVMILHLTLHVTAAVKQKPARCVRAFGLSIIED
ncbi:hypothetical protein DET47_101241 [Shewanella putrefaciens]|nr:hypothetical protein DET47_101241 [Shewanella putrefaciens]